MNFYIDTCIWLNLFKKESKNNIKYWLITKRLIKILDNPNNNIIVSTIVLKELYFKSRSKFNMIKNFLIKIDSIKMIKTTPNDYYLARKIENIHNFKISFYDCIHIAISKRINASIITRDKDLIKIGKRYIQIIKPEDLINKRVNFF